jgi:hypothetical protein
MVGRGNPHPQKMHTCQGVTAAFVRNMAAPPLALIYSGRRSP